MWRSVDHQPTEPSAASLAISAATYAPVTARGQRSTFPSPSDGGSAEVAAAALLVSHSQDLPRKSITGSPPLPASPAARPSLEPPFIWRRRFRHLQVQSLITLTGPALTASERTDLEKSLQPSDPQESKSRKLRRHERHQREHGGTSRPHSYSSTDRRLAFDAERRRRRLCQPNTSSGFAAIRPLVSTACQGVSGQRLPRQPHLAAPSLPPTPYPVHSHRALG